MYNWLSADANSAEGLIFTTIKKCLQIMGEEAGAFSANASAYIISNAGESLTDLQKNAIDTAARSIYVHRDDTLATGLNAILTQPWEYFGVRYMPEGSAMTPQQRLDFIAGIYGYAFTRISQHVGEMQMILSVPYSHPAIPATQ